MSVKRCISKIAFFRIEQLTMLFAALDKKSYVDYE